MMSLMEIEKRIKDGDMFTLNQQNDEYSYGVFFVVNAIRNQENIYGYHLGTEMVEQLNFMFPRIKFYLEFHGCYYQAKYDSTSKQFLSSIMTMNFQKDDSVFSGLIGNADTLIDSMFALEERITMLMQESELLRKIKIESHRIKV